MIGAFLQRLEDHLLSPAAVHIRIRQVLDQLAGPVLQLHHHPRPNEFYRESITLAPDPELHAPFPLQVAVLGPGTKHRRVAYSRRGFHTQRAILGSSAVAPSTSSHPHFADALLAVWMRKRHHSSCLKLLPSSQAHKSPIAGLALGRLVAISKPGVPPVTCYNDSSPGPLRSNSRHISRTFMGVCNRFPHALLRRGACPSCGRLRRR